MGKNTPDLHSAQWRKSSHSSDTGGECIEVAAIGSGTVAVRDSKDPEGPALTFSPEAFTAFVAAAATDTLR